MPPTIELYLSNNSDEALDLLDDFKLGAKLRETILIPPD